MPDNDKQAPPKGDLDQAQKYINQLVDLINQKKIEVYHTDLTKFDPNSLKDHYTIGLRDYQIEISHSRNQETDKNSYVMIFNNLKNISEGSGEKVILAYMYLEDSQFSKFKIVADRQIEERIRAEEEKKFKEALIPIDDLLTQASTELSEENVQESISKEIRSDDFEDYKQEQQTHQV